MHHKQNGSRLSVPLAAILVPCLLVAAAAGQDRARTQSEADAALVEPFLTDSTFVILRVDSSRLALADFEATLGPASDVRREYTEAATRFNAAARQLSEALDDSVLYGVMGIPISTKRVPASLFVRKKSAEHGQRLIAFLDDLKLMRAQERDSFIVAQPANVAESDHPFNRTAAPDLEVVSAAFDAVAEYPTQLLLIPPEHFRRTVRELSPELPSQLGGGPSSVLTEGVRWAAIGFDPTRLRAQLVIQSASADAAGELAAHIPKMIRSLLASTPEQVARSVGPLLESVAPQVAGDKVSLSVDGLQQAGANLQALTAVLNSFRLRESRSSVQQQMQQIMIAMHVYHDTHRAFPPSEQHRDEDGKSQLSWRVHVLPYIGEEALYRKFRLDEPWDSQHNKALLGQMPEIYTTDADVPAGHTTLLAPVGEGTVFGQPEPTQFRHIIDGTSNTGVLVQVLPKLAVPWTAPADYHFDPEQPLAGVQVDDEGKWLCAFADGSTHIFRSDADARTLRNLFQMNDRQVINTDELR